MKRFSIISTLLRPPAEGSRRLRNRRRRRACPVLDTGECTPYKICYLQQSFQLKLFLVLSALTALAGYAFAHLGKWLVVKSPLPANADIIFVFSGETRRTEYALELAGQYPHAVILCAESDAQYIQKIAGDKKTGINIHVLPPCSSTIDEVRALKKYLQTYLPIQSPVPYRFPSEIEGHRSNDKRYTS